MQRSLGRIICFLLVQVMIMMVGAVYAVEDLPGSANSDPIYQQLRQIKLSGKAAAVQNLVLKRDAATFTFKKGTFYFLEAVEKQFTGALFIGEGEFYMTPVLKVEQQHLKHLTGGPSITEKFSKMVLRFTDDTYKEITASGSVQPVASISKAEDYLKKNRKLLRKGRKYSRPPGSGGYRSAG